MEDKLEKALKELLVTSNVVILPGFGAFVATDIPAMVDSQNNVIYPPRRKVNYNPDMTTDDGMLTGHYARQERISKDTATEHIAQFVEEVNHRLHRGNPWIVEDLGKFIIDGLNHLNFFPDPDQNFVPQSFGLPEVELLTGAKAEYPEIEHVEPVVKPQPKKKEEKKKEEKKKEKKEVVGGEKKKKSKKWLVVLLILVLLGGGAFAFLTQTEQGKHIAEDLKHKIDGMLGKKEHKEEPKKETAALVEVPADSTATPADTATAQVAEHTEKKEEPKAGASYQPRSGQVAFDTPDRLDIEPTKLDQYVKEDKNKKAKADDSNYELTAQKTAPKPAPAKATKTEAAKTKEKTTTEKTTAEKTTPNRNSNPDKSSTKADDDYIPKNVKPIKSGESIYSRYQVVVSEFKSIEDAVSSSDRYNKMGFNVAVIQFKDGKFGVCLARTSDKAKADKMLAEINKNFNSARIKEYNN